MQIVGQLLTQLVGRQHSCLWELLEGLEELKVLEELEELEGLEGLKMLGCAMVIVCGR